MRKIQIILILGILITILPYSGFPYDWKNILSTLMGLIVVFTSYLLYKDFKKKENKGKTFDNFRENNNFQETTI